MTFSPLSPPFHQTALSRAVFPSNCYPSSLFFFLSLSRSLSLPSSPLFLSLPSILPPPFPFLSYCISPLPFSLPLSLPFSLSPSVPPFLSSHSLCWESIVTPGHTCVHLPCDFHTRALMHLLHALMHLLHALMHLLHTLMYLFHEEANVPYCDPRLLLKQHSFRCYEAKKREGSSEKED